MKKQTYGIVGYPVKHSLSPSMQNAAFRRLKIGAGYQLFEVKPAALERFLSRIRLERNISGLNITVPHKIRAKEYLERNGSLDEDAARLGAVNTIKVFSDGSLRGFNTDGPGFYRSLVEDLKFEPKGRNIFVLGAGGAAKAIVMYLGGVAKSISVFDLDRRKTGELKRHYRKYFDEKTLKIVSNAKEIGRSLDKSDLCVNATPIGMNGSDPSPIPKEFLRSGLYVYDLVYNASRTQLIKDAYAAKAHASTGLGMLLYQGTAAFEIWTGRAAPVTVMARALKEAISRQK